MFAILGGAPGVLPGAISFGPCVPGGPQGRAQNKRRARMSQQLGHSGPAFR